jgi:hypothetical protein
VKRATRVRQHQIGTGDTVKYVNPPGNFISRRYAAVRKGRDFYIALALIGFKKSVLPGQKFERRQDITSLFSSSSSMSQKVMMKWNHILSSDHTFQPVDQLPLYHSTLLRWLIAQIERDNLPRRASGDEPLQRPVLSESCSATTSFLRFVFQVTVEVLRSHSLTSQRRRCCHAAPRRGPGARRRACSHSVNPTPPDSCSSSCETN